MGHGSYLMWLLCGQFLTSYTFSHVYSTWDMSYVSSAGSSAADFDLCFIACFSYIQAQLDQNETSIEQKTNTHSITLCMIAVDNNFTLRSIATNEIGKSGKCLCVKGTDRRGGQHSMGNDSIITFP